MIKPLSSYHHSFYWLHVKQRRLFHRINWYCSIQKYKLDHKSDGLLYILLYKTYILSLICFIPSELQIIKLANHSVVNFPDNG